MLSDNNKIQYKTTPWLFLITMPILGGVFFGLFSVLILTSSVAKYTLFEYILSIIFIIPSFIAIYYLLKIRIIYLTDKELVVKNLFLPYYIKFNYSEVRGMKQITERSFFYLDSFTKTHTTIVRTIIELNDGSKIKLLSVIGFDFADLEKAFFKLKRGEGRVKVHRIDWRMYLVMSVLEIVITILLLIPITGLSLALLFGD